ncbi:hypothetical protein CAP36_15625 [Chitinophagaceae bacterium IBVUCB2]|nr:hypothetical protein CAP36_15625 [Chitinophagaceae bacterium IBVUCB2]
MKYVLTSIIIIFLTVQVTAQQKKYFSAAIFTTQNALPFGKFTGLFGGTFHPGFELGYGKVLRPKTKHEWFLELRLAYFFHRYVQHGIPLYLNFGYRYKINNRLSAETSLGAGYMHSIPATAKLKLNENGEYENNKGAGRMQATASYALGFSYILNPASLQPLRIFTTYQQRLQMPFVKSYVPLLPYNSFMIGLSQPLSKKK